MIAGNRTHRLALVSANCLGQHSPAITGGGTIAAQADRCASAAAVSPSAAGSPRPPTRTGRPALRWCPRR
ncbi:hypothetical protein MAHJHV45_47230 [Mycobacterium avium subsp. hominissuis]